MKINFLQKSALKQTFLNRNFLFFSILYVLFFTLLEEDPANGVLLIILEGVVMAVLGFLIGLFKMEEVKNVIGRFFVGIILLPLNLFFLIISLSLIAIFSSPDIDLQLFESPGLHEFMTMGYENSWNPIIVIQEMGTNYIYFMLATGLFFLYNQTTKKKGDTMETSAFKATAYCGILSLVSLVALFVAFIIQYIIPGSFPFTFLFATRVGMGYAKQTT